MSTFPIVINVALCAPDCSRPMSTPAQHHPQYKVTPMIYRIHLSNLRIDRFWWGCIMMFGARLESDGVDKKCNLWWSWKWFLTFNQVQFSSCTQDTITPFLRRVPVSRAPDHRHRVIWTSLNCILVRGPLADMTAALEFEIFYKITVKIDEMFPFQFWWQSEIKHKIKGTAPRSALSLCSVFSFRVKILSHISSSHQLLLKLFCF